MDQRDYTQLWHDTDFKLLEESRSQCINHLFNGIKVHTYAESLSEMREAIEAESLWMGQFKAKILSFQRNLSHHRLQLEKRVKSEIKAAMVSMWIDENPPRTLTSTSK